MSARTPRVSVYYRAQRGQWSVRWREHGKQREKPGFATEDDAQAFAVEQRRRLRNPFSAPHQASSTVGQLLAEWWDEYACTDRIKPGTRELYGRCMNVILDSMIVDVPASDVTTAHVNVWTAQLQDVGDSTIRNMLVVLGSAFTYGIKVGIVSHNPVRGAERPDTTRKLPVIPTMQDVLRLAMTPPEPEARWRSLLAVAAFCGLRQQECFALQWSSVQAGSIIVREAVSGTAKRVIESPKTETGLRVVPMPGFVADALEQHRAESSGTGLVWGNAKGKPYATSNFHSMYWQSWRDRAGVKVQWKHLRHFYASQLAASGASPLQASRWMGHKTYGFTMDTYGFLFDADTPAVMDALTARLSSL